MAQSREEFAEYVRARRELLRRLAYSLCGNWHQADDIVQIALAKLYVAWPRISRKGNEDAYVRRVIANTAVDESRRPWRREIAVDAIDSDLMASAANAAIAEPAEAPQNLVEALQLLPVMQRRVVVLRHWLDMSVSDVAADLGISEGTVKSHSSRAMARLHHLLVDPANEEMGQ